MTKKPGRSSPFGYSDYPHNKGECNNPQIRNAFEARLPGDQKESQENRGILVT